MGVVHMNPAEAVQAHLDLEARQSVAMHYGTFRLTSEGIDDPVRALESARQERQVAPDRFTALDFGASLRVG
jgi:L-ascorbate metabolism protein UlaG (beta-lactamase superfamily)